MDIATSVAVIAGLMLINTIFIVAALVRAIRTLGEVNKFAEMARLQLAPIAHDAAQILSDIRSIVKSIDKEMGKVGDSLTAVRETALSLREFEASIRQRVERPLVDLVTLLSALVTGARVFWSHFAKSDGSETGP